MKKHFLIALFILGFSNFSFSQTQLDMNESASKKYKKADLELNKSYKLLTSKLDASEKSLLKIAQNNWIKYRDAHCKFEANQYEGGSMQPLILFTCLEEVTKKRTAELKQSLKDRNN
jgi:uncharacterized protein YecT (DUF1311 family)